MKNIFSSYHPLVNFSFFLAVILFTMFIMHPIFLCISLCAAVVYALCLGGKKAARTVIVYLPMLLVLLIITPAFNHEGVTILTYLPDGNALTLESIIYAIATAKLMAAVISWFYCFNRIVTSDKFVYLFGKIIPTMSLVLSMTLRFVPRFIRQFSLVREAQRGLGQDISKKTLIPRIKTAGAITSAMITWSLENAIETADSMKNRGYSLPGRTSFSLYRFVRRDGIVLTLILVMSLYVLIGVITGECEFYYYPYISDIATSAYSLSIYSAYFVLCFIPIIIHIKEEIKWKRLRSKI